MNSGYEKKNTIEILKNGKNGVGKHYFEFKTESERFVDSPKISVIIPVFQEEKILEKTLQKYSDILRTKYNFELIISDGGSTDRTIEIAQKYADIVVRHNEPRKQTIAEGRNKGASASRGDLLVFINADTVPENPELFFNFISQLIDGKNKFSKFDALATRVYVAKDERLFKDLIFYFFHNFYVRLLNMIGLGMGRGECQIIKRTVFEKVGGYNPKIIAGEDFDLYKRISSVGSIGFVNELVVLESPRRFRKYGYLRIIFSWVVNSLSVIFYGKSVSDEWEPVR
ncbi:MAG: glycosyltransferase [Candidatus Kapabacteria bacterium]|nr:glycosyltransferase [Candidatus Kapabacteria bacterium]